MNFYMTFNRYVLTGGYAKVFFKLKLTFILFITVILQVGASSFAQINLNEKNASLHQVLQKIKHQTGYDLFYSSSLVKKASPITIQVKNASLMEVLNLCFADQPLVYQLEQNTIIVRPKEEKIQVMVSTGTLRPPVNVIGKVLDENDRPISGVTIRVKNNPQIMTITDVNGDFRLTVPSEKDLLVFTYIGKKSQEVSVMNYQAPLRIKLKEEEQSMKDIVITGTGINRSKDSFTGTTAIFTGDELKAISNNNVIQSLRTLDPSFLLIENNLAGSNPNALPVIEVRGKSSIPSETLKDQFGSDPNQPLFILDGFPTTLQTIIDLDINRVASVTILKDAASTALYGSQASNGVVVVETIRPKSGELQLMLSQDFRFELPDLSHYNMMNASEKLEFERLSGRYTSEPSNPSLGIYLDSLYHRHLSYVQKGVDSYWLNEPLQTGYSTNTSLNAMGGDAAFTYGVGINYRVGEGAMIGSGRDTYSGSINLTYRKKAFNINNITYIRGFSSQNSNFGSFANFVNANPYFDKNTEGKYLEVSRQGNVNGTVLRISNPLYDALLPQYDKTKNTEIQNNLHLTIDLNRSFRLNGGLQLTKGSTVNKVFYSPEMSRFDNTPTLRKGRYTDDRRTNFSYQANLMLTYYKVVNQKHTFNVNWRNTIAENLNERYSSSAEGFPVGSPGNPIFAYNYLENGSPTASYGIFRMLNTTLSANYSFAGKYLIDALYRLDGSTAYGSNKQFSPYYSFGLGWNLHNELLFKQQSWISNLRLTGNIGITGNQNFANISSVSVFDYNSNNNYNYFGQGLTLLTFGNPNLAPQKTRQISTSLEFSFFNNRFSGYLNAYDKKTDPLIVPVDLPSSTGVFNYPYNVGNLTYRGMETKLTFFPIYKLAQRITWNIGITGSTYRSRYDGIGNSLNTLNKQQELNKSLIRYQDGNSAETIWAIKSMGIDPTTGREVFLTRDGQYTFDYNAAHITNAGNTVALAEGVLSTSLRIKNFTVSGSFRYRVGGDIYNTVLANKVENISFTSTAFNQDRRALYDRWKNPGDVAQFKSISQRETTPISSRFVQKENYITGESINIGYVFDNHAWLKGLGLRNLQLNAMTNDLFTQSTIRRERGIQYPYAKTFALSLRASF